MPTERAKRFLKRHIRHHIRDLGMPPKQAVAVAYSEARSKGLIRGKRAKSVGRVRAKEPRHIHF